MWYYPAQNPRYTAKPVFEDHPEDNQRQIVFVRSIVFLQSLGKLKCGHLSHVVFIYRWSFAQVCIYGLGIVER